MVDHARIPVAALFGFTVPPSLAEEREMWQAVNTLVRRPYQEARDRGIEELFEKYRSRPHS